MSDLFDDTSDGLRIAVVDVGHGNCTVISEDGVAVLVDAGSGAAVLEFLRSEGITDVEAVVISHADHDHIGGLVALLASQTVDISNIYINSDALKDSSAWSNLAYELDELRRNGSLQVRIGVVEGDSIPTRINGVELKAVAPRHRLAQTGAGSIDLDGRRITTNSMSAVLKVVVDGNSVALLSGDIDWAGFSHLKDTAQDLKADVLVIPHHGGSGGTVDETVRLTEELCAAVCPREILISNGRGRHNNPRPSVIKVVRETLPEAHIACTQLSKVCRAQLVEGERSLDGTYAAGAERNSCCAGTLEFRRGDGVGSPRDTTAHDLFVGRFAATALCRVQALVGGSENSEALDI